MTIYALLEVICPDFVALSSETQAVWIALAEERVARNQFGKLADQAVAYLTAHLFTLARNLGATNGTGGAIASESEGGISRSYALPDMNDETSLKSTGYGLQFLELRKQSVFGLMNRQINVPEPYGLPFRYY